MIKQFLIAIAAFAVLDGIWLGFIMKDFNMRMLADIGRIEDGKFQLVYWAAALAYLLMALSVVVFVLPRVAGVESFLHVFVLGALMGLIVYGIFDFTNLAILKNYPIPFALADVAWGTFAYGAVTLITHKFAG